MSARVAADRAAVVALGWPLVVVMALGAIGFLPTRRLAGATGVEAMMAALGVVLGAVYATLLPAMRRMTAAADPAARFKAAFRAGLERMVITLAVAGAIAWRVRLDVRSFLVWVAISYVVTIKVETLILIRWSRRLEKR